MSEEDTFEQIGVSANRMLAKLKERMDSAAKAEDRGAVSLEEWVGTTARSAKREAPLVNEDSR